MKCRLSLKEFRLTLPKVNLNLPDSIFIISLWSPKNVSVKIIPNYWSNAADGADGKQEDLIENYRFQIAWSQQKLFENFWFFLSTEIVI